MFNRDWAVPIELVEIEPKGVPAYDRADVNTGQTDNECHGKVEVVTIHDRLGGSPERDAPARSVDVTVVSQRVQERARGSNGPPVAINKETYQPKRGRSWRMKEAYVPGALYW